MKLVNKELFANLSLTNKHVAGRGGATPAALRPVARQLLFAATAAALLTGCATPEEKAARVQADMDQMMQVYGPACTRLGYPSNSDQWRDCVLQLSAKDDIQRYGPAFYGSYGRRPWSMGGFWGPW